MTIRPISPLGQRMIEDMTIRRLKERTQDFYLRSVTKYAQHFRTSPAKLDYEHVREYQLHLVQSGWKPSYVNHAMSALRFFYEVTMGASRRAGDDRARTRTEEAIRQILTPEEVVRLIEAAPSRKYRRAFRIAYGAGLRSSEVGVAKGLRHRQRTHGATHRGWQGRQGSSSTPPYARSIAARQGSAPAILKVANFWGSVCCRYTWKGGQHETGNNVVKLRER